MNPITKQLIKVNSIFSICIGIGIAIKSLELTTLIVITTSVINWMIVKMPCEIEI